MKKSTGHLRRQLKKQAKKRGLNRPKLLAEQLEARILLAADFDLTPHREYMDSAAYQDQTNMLDAHDVNNDGYFNMQDGLLLVEKARMLMTLTGAPTYHFDSVSINGAVGEGDSGSDIGVTSDASGERIFLDTNGDGVFDVRDPYHTIGQLRAEGEHNGSDHVAEFTFSAFEAANPAFIAPANGNDTQGTPNPDAVEVLNFNVNQAANLTVAINDVRQATQESDRGVGSAYLDIAFEQGFSNFEVVARPGAFGNGAFVFNSVESTNDLQAGEVFASFNQPLGVRDLGYSDFNDFFTLNGPQTIFADLQISFGGARKVALLDTAGVVQGQSVNVNVTNNDTFDTTFTVTGSEPTSANDLITVFQTPANQAMPDDIDFGTQNFEIVAPDGSPLQRRIQNLSQPGKGSASINDNGTPNDFSDDTIDYQANANATGTDTFTYELSDGFSVVTGTVEIEIGEVNDPPVLTTPATATTNENTAVGIATSVSDPDALALPLNFTITATSGNLGLSSTTGLTGVSGNNTTNLTFAGSQADANAALSGLTYTPIGEFNGLDSVVVNVNDNGNSGVGGAQQDTETIAITVNPVNDPPVVTVPAGPLAVFNTETLTVTGLSLADIDAGNGIMHVEFEVANGTLSLNSSVGLTLGGSGGVLTADGTLADINTALGNGLVYDPVDTFIGDDTLDFRANDQGNTGGPAEMDADSVIIGVTPPRLPFARDDSFSVEEDSTAGPSNQIDVFFNDLNGAIVSGGADLTLDAFTQASMGVVTHDQNGTPTDLTDDTFTYVPNAEFNGSDSFTYTISDSVNTPNDGPHTGTVNITVNPVNDAPILINPSTDSTDEDISVTFTGISFTDIDVANGQMTLNVTSTNGTVSTNGSNASSNLTLNGTLTQLNTALTNLTYNPAPDFFGTAVVDITINDNGNTGSGGNRSDNGVITVTVNSINDAPIVSVPGAAQSVTKNFDHVFSTANGNPITVADVDAGSDDVTVTVDISTNDAGLIGSIALASPNSVNVTNSSATSITFDGTISEVNDALNGLTYSPGADFVGFTTTAVAINDNGANGAGGAMSDNNSVVVEVLDFVPSDFSGFVFLDTDRGLDRDAIEKGLGGIDVSINGTDITGNSINATTTTDSTGRYEFQNLAPPLENTDYTITIDPAQAGHYMDGQDVIGSQGGTALANTLLIPRSVFLVDGQPLGGVSGTENNFTFSGADGRFVNPFQFILASNQGDGQTPLNRILMSVAADGSVNNWLDFGGWSSFDDFRLLNITRDGNGVAQSATLEAINGSTTSGNVNFPDIKEIGTDARGNRMYWIEGPVNLSQVEPQGEGEGEAQISEDLEFEGEASVELLLAAMEREAAQDFERAVDEVFTDLV